MNNMKKVTQQQMRKVYGPSNQQEVQLNAVRKINSLLSSGAVSVTGPIQPRILKQKSEISSPIQQNNIKQLRCYTCDQICTHSTSQCLTQTLTVTTKTKLPNKIGRIVGDAFMVIVCEDDVICNQCLQQFNQLDRFEHDAERIRNSLLNSIYRKYGITDDDQTGSPQQPQIIQQPQSQPIQHQPPKLTTVTTSQPNKIQKLNNSTQYYSRKISSSTSNQSDDNAEEVLTRKIPISQQQNVVNRSQNIVVSRNIVNNNDSVENQLSNLFEPSNNEETIRQVPVQQPNIKKGPIKIYKCMSCEYKASDLKLFQSHYNECKQTQLAQQQQIQAQQQQQIQQSQQQQQVLQTGYRCKICKKLFTSIPALKQHTSEKHSQNQQTTLMINDSQTIKLEPEQKLIQPQTITQITLYSCTLCKYETQDKRTYDEHLKKHGKLKPFKCRLCSMRFETREQASVHTKTHQPDYFKCGSCSMSFPQREMLIKHFETHEKQLKQQTTQKLLQDTIDEALRGTENHDNLETTTQQLPTVTSVTEKPINFFTCDICAVTFLQEDYYNQHMETHHKQLITTSGALTNQTGNLLTTAHNSQNIQTSQQQQLSHSSGGNTRQNAANIQTAILTQSNQQQSQQNSISDADLESIFEKIHSDNKNDMDTMVVTTNNGNINSGANDGTNTVSNVVITSQENSGGGITFNITIPQGEELNLNQEQKIMQQIRAEAENQDSQEDQQHHVSIDMPVLETMDETTQQHIQNQIKQQQQQQQQEEENNQEQQIVGGGSVSMPSLDDDVDSQNTHANNDTVAMDLDDVQNSVDAGQIKFILNDDQLLQLNDHIITDSEGNQILVQGTDSEHIQQLLQSVGVIQTSEGLDGETTLHMLNENNQMIIVQDGNGETQLIDASMLNADGQIVIQQAHDDDNSQSAGEDGGQIPVSATYTQAGDIEMHHQMHDDGSQDQHHQIIESAENSEEIKQLQDHHHQQQQQDEQNKQQQMVISGGDHAEHVLVKEENEFSESTNEQPVTTEASSTT